MKFKHLIIGLAVIGFSLGNPFCSANVKAMTLGNENKEEPLVKDSLKVVKTYLASIDKRRWHELLKLIPEDRKDFWTEFLGNKKNENNNLGVLNVTSAKIKEIKLIPEDGMMKIMSIEDYKLNYSNIESYLVGIDYRVKSENIHYFNGIRYELFIVGWKINNPYILADLDAPLEKIIPNGLGFNSLDERKALNIIKEKYKGRYINNNGDLLEENKGLKVKLKPNMKIYRYSELGYEISYPDIYYVVLSGGHSPVANPEYGPRLSLVSKDSRIILDIDSVDKVNYMEKYKNYEEFIKYKHINLRLDEEIVVNHKHCNIYKIKEDNYYFSFFENDDHIFELSSNSKEFLKAIIHTFEFI